MKLQLGPESVSRTQISGLLMLGLFSMSPNQIPAQGPASPKSPMEVLQAYRKMDLEGERLTPSGWYRGSTFFVKPGRPPQHNVVAVVDGERIDDHPKVNGNRAEVSVLCSAIGQIDSSGHFTSVVATGTDPSGRPLGQPGIPQMHGPAPLVRVYDLVLTDTHWELGPGGEGLREVKGPPEWRIETFEFEPWVAIKVAIQYLTHLRDESVSEVIKRNADKSIATLRRLL
jgi:hypothetical protein